MTDFTEKDLSDEGKEWFDTINEEVDAFTVDSLRHFLFENSTINRIKRLIMIAFLAFT